MQQNNSHQIKVEMPEEFNFSVSQYPTINQRVKIQLDDNIFPPVKWYPILPKTIPQEQYKTNSSQNKLIHFTQSLRTALLEVLSSEETDRFVGNYDIYRHRRIYVMIIIAFAKWRSNKQLTDFQTILSQQTQTRNIPHLSCIPPQEPLAQWMKACQYYLEGFPDKAVRQLYYGLPESLIRKVLTFIKQLDQQIRINRTPKPDFDTEDNYSPQLPQQQYLQAKSAQYSQIKPRELIYDGSFPQQESRIVTIIEQPFLIRLRQDLGHSNHQYLSANQPLAKVNGKFRDWVCK